MGVLTDWQIERDITITPFSPAQKRDNTISYGVSSYGYDVRLGYKLRVFKPYPCTVIDPKNFDPRMLEDVDLTPSSHEWDSLGVCKKCKTCVGDNPPPDCEFVPDHIIIPPHSFVLGESLEEFRFPRDITCIVLGKSTYARCGLIVNVTPGEPDWQGRWTIELSNTTDLPMKVYVGEGIMQCVFLRSDARYELALAAIADYLDVPNPPVEEGWAPPTKEEAANYLRQLVMREGPIFKEATCHQSYADKKGKYQNQGGLTLPEVDKLFAGPVTDGETAAFHQAEQKRLDRMRVMFSETVIEPTVEKLFPGTPFSVHYNSLPGSMITKSRDEVTIDEKGMVWQVAPPKPLIPLPPLTPDPDHKPPKPTDPRPPVGTDTRTPHTTPDGHIWVWSDRQNAWIRVTDKKGDLR